MSINLKNLRYLLIDLDGVLYRGDQILGGAAQWIEWLREQGIGFRLVTNNATLTQSQYVTKLGGMGIQVREDEVFTSSLATALYLERQGAVGQAAYVIGEAGVIEALRGIGMTVGTGEPEWVVVGLDRHVTYDKLADAALAIRAGATFVGTNPDTSFPTERGLLPGAGALQAVLIAATGVQPVVVGKPEPLMLQLAMASLGGTVANTAMLGDRLDTDILGAHRLRIPSILVLTGVSTREDVGQNDVRPHLVVDNLPDLMQQWTEALG